MLYLCITVYLIPSQCVFLPVHIIIVPLGSFAQKHNRLLSPFISIILQKEKITLIVWVRSDDSIHKFEYCIKHKKKSAFDFYFLDLKKYCNKTSMHIMSFKVSCLL